MVLRALVSGDPIRASTVREVLEGDCWGEEGRT